MTINVKLRNLNRAKDEFSQLSKSSHRKARLYKFIDLFIKAVLSIGGGLITYFAEPSSADDYKIIIRIFGIIIAGLTALTSVFMFEKRSMANIQIYNKCSVVIADLDDKIDAVKNGEQIGEDLQEYIKRTFKELSNMNLATFTDSALEKIQSKREL
jgi:hypothetical protein